MPNAIAFPITLNDFTGPAGSVTPTAAGLIYRATDVTPERFYISTATELVSLGEHSYGMFDTDAETFNIVLNPSHYSPAPVTLGDEDVTYGAVGPNVPSANKLWGFTIQCPHATYWAIPWVLSQLQAAASATPSTGGAVTVWDALHVRPEDLAQGYTVRRCKITEIQPQGGSVEIDGEQWYPGGFSARFTEIDLDGVSASTTVPSWSESGVWG